MTARHTPTRKKPTESPGLSDRKPEARSRVTNGSQLFLGADGRSSKARRLRDVYADLTTRTGGEHEQLCRGLATMIVQRELLDAALARGEPIDTMILVRLVGAIGRVMLRTGLDASTNKAPAEDEPHDGTEAMLEHLRRASGATA